jgi:DNA-directed RNA polymerase sigma subunit (sigma70/sigma32)
VALATQPNQTSAEDVAASEIDAAIQSNLQEITTGVLVFLRPREERVLRMRFGIGMNSDHTLRKSANGSR